ncbi:MAG: D-aminoacyl-tRNA deacylase, partial [Candidatus Ranarchaeia archaeon]
QLLNRYKFEKTKEIFDASPVYRLMTQNGQRDTTIKLVVIDNELLFADYLEQNFSSDLYVFVSRHTSKSGKPGLLVHSTGNWGQDISMGGRPRELAVAPGAVIRAAIKLLETQRERHGLSEYPVTLEVTHHGPTSMDTPLIFVEVGSRLQQWQDPLAAAAIADTVYAIATRYEKIVNEPIVPVVGVGGTHYCPNFNKLIRNTRYATTHIIPKYHVDKITREILISAFKRSVGRPKALVLDWKGLTSNQRKKMIEMAGSLSCLPKIEIFRVSQLIRTS